MWHNVRDLRKDGVHRKLMRSEKQQGKCEEEDEREITTQSDSFFVLFCGVQFVVNIKEICQVFHYGELKPPR